MKKLATGYYNSVYDLGNGYVFKKKNTFVERFKKIYSEQHSVIKTIKVMVKIPKEHLSLLEKEIQEGSFAGDLSILANPVFKNGGYVQDKVITIKDYFAMHDLGENKKIIDKYIESIYQCWKYHIHEEVFNFTVNNGVDSHSDVVLIDFNETSRDKEAVKKCIANKRWLKSMSYLTLNSELKDYYTQAMEQGITEQVLNKYWY